MRLHNLPTPNKKVGSVLESPTNPILECFDFIGLVTRFYSFLFFCSLSREIGNLRSIVMYRFESIPSIQTGVAISGSVANMAHMVMRRDCLYLIQKAAVLPQCIIDCRMCELKCRIN